MGDGVVLVLRTQKRTVAEFDEFVLLPENIDREFEFIGGRIYDTLSSPLSSATAVRIAGFLGNYLLSNDIGHLTGADGGYIVASERYIPDVAFISYTRQPELSYTGGYNPIAPDLAVEVLSPGNDDEKMRVKIHNYQVAGTVVWVADVESLTIEVYLPGTPVITRGINDVLEGGSVLPGFKVAVKDIFSSKPNPE
jgi:Uma2 family endonuclease